MKLITLALLFALGLNAQADNEAEYQKWKQANSRQVTLPNGDVLSIVSPPTVTHPATEVTPAPAPVPVPVQETTTTIKVKKNHDKWKKFGLIVAQVGATVYLTTFCNDLRTKPLIYYTADDVQNMNACIYYGY